MYIYLSKDLLHKVAYFLSGLVFIWLCSHYEHSLRPCLVAGVVLLIFTIKFDVTPPPW